MKEAVGGSQGNEKAPLVLNNFNLDVYRERQSRLLAGQGQENQQLRVY